MGHALEPETNRGPNTNLGVFAEGGEVGADLARVDWTSTALGDPSGWPQSLRATVRLVLSSRFSMWMAWGPELTFFCNAAYRRDTLGRKYPWALGRPASEVWEEIWPDIGPRIHRVLSTGEATWDEGLLLFLERSGYPEETYHTGSYSPLRDDSGTVAGMLCVVTEDTARVISERRLATLRDLGSDPTVVRTEEELLAFSAGQLGRNQQDLPFTLTYLLDGDGGARLAASSGIQSGSPAAPTKLHAADAIWPVSQAAAGWATTVELGGGVLAGLPGGAWPEPPTAAFVAPLVTQGGTPSGFLVAGLNRYCPLDDAYRGFIGLVAAQIAGGIASARSYAAQQQRAVQLAELDQAKTAFFANISHEFRTPLALILGPLAEITRSATDLDTRTREELEVAYSNGLRLAKLVNTLLDFSRIEAGRMEPHYQPVDLADFTAELASVFRSAIERAGLELKVDCSPVGQPVYIDRDIWEKVIFNLLSNALKFTLEGSITVAVHNESDTAVVTVADTGIGVAPEEVHRLFERFHRIPTNAARSAEGSGIGLALVKELIALHGGTITAESVEGHGTTFTIRLPLGTDHLPETAVIGSGETSAPTVSSGETYLREALRWTPATPGADGAATSASGTPSPATVLIADDNADMREYLTRLLSAGGYRVVAAADGRQALDAVRSDIPDLVITDVMMPNMDGLELVSALRDDQRTALVPVVLLSARAGQEASIEGLRAGANDYLVKPFSSEELLARVETNIALARQRSRHDRWRSALIDSLQEAFFVCRLDGTMVEFNEFFTDMVGWGREGLPYSPPYPWWPDPDIHPDEYRRIHDAFYDAMETDIGPTPFVIQHRDGHLLWVDITSTRTEDPTTGEPVTVGTFRDVTEEHYREQRQTALAELNEELARADNVPDAVRAAVRHGQRLWAAERVVAATFATGTARRTPPELIVAGRPAQWGDLPEATRRRIRTLAENDDLLVADTDTPGESGIALQHPDGVLVLWFQFSGQAQLTPEEVTLGTVLASRLSQGLHRLRQIDQQRETALALQQAILGPATLPVGFAARYQPATQPLEVGGDWYDVIRLDDRRIAMVVGDCVGHGLNAAAVMGQLSSACRALLLELLDPAETLNGLDRFAAGLAGAHCTTACAAVLNTVTGELTYAAAGHPPPVLVHPDGTSTILEDGRSIPLGVRINQNRPSARTIVPPGATVLLYTDGLVERRHESVDQGIDRAVGLLRGEQDTGLREVADKLMAVLTPADGYQDDVAVLLYRRPSPFEVSIAARAAELAPARAAFRRWLTAIGVPALLNHDVLLAAGEAMANSIEHGHRNKLDGTVTLQAAVTGSLLTMTVTDTGRWKSPDLMADRYRGRGVPLMRELMDDIVIEPCATGTTVQLSVSLP